MRTLGALVLPIGLIASCAPALAADGLPNSGEANIAAYLVCQPLAVVDMGAAGAQSAIECHGIVRNHDGGKAPDNLAIHCLESTTDRAADHKYSAACTQTDGDGDKLYMTYEGANSGQLKWIGGTGKYEGVSGSGDLTVVVAPAGNAKLFAFTLSSDVTWKKSK